MMLIFEKEVFSIIGASIEVHRILGHGFLEAVYQEALDVELRLRDIPSAAQRPMAIGYKSVTLTKMYVPDFICFEKIIVELKAQESLQKRDDCQILNYLKASKMRLGLLINFGSINKLEWRRIIY